MVKLTRIYTRSGDKGKTSLGSGERILKCDIRIEAIGAVDEVNAALGVCRLHLESSVDDDLRRIQNDLFDLGADLCVPDMTMSALRVVAEQVSWLENRIDHYNEQLLPLESFVLPGGTVSAAHLHMARTITRRAERSIIALQQHVLINPEIVHYINRLSDLLFVLARFVNELGKSDVLWVPGAHRS